MTLAKTKGASTAIITTRTNLNFDKLFFILVLTTPLIIIPRIFPSWEIGKIFWFWTVVEIWFWFRLATKGLHLSKNLRSVFISLLLYLLFLLLESYLSGGNAFWGGWWRRQGWWFMVHLGILFYLVFSADLDQKFIFRALKTFLLLTVVSGLVLWPSHQRFSGTLGEANSWGIFAALALVLAMKLKQPRSSSILFFVGLLLSQSRSALASLVVLITKTSLPVKLALLIIGLAFIGWFNFVRGTGERLELWSFSFNLWQAHPWFGIGLDNFQAVFTKFMEGKGLGWQYYDHPHNIILWLLVSSGALGFGLFAGWLYLTFSYGKNDKNQIFKKLALSILIFGLFQPLSTAVSVYLFTFMALIVWSPGSSQPNQSSRNSLYQLWTLLLGIGTWWFIVWQTANQYFFIK